MSLDCASWVLVLVPTLVSCKIMTSQKAPGDDTSFYSRILYQIKLKFQEIGIMADFKHGRNAKISFLLTKL